MDCKEGTDEQRKMSHGGWGGRRWSDGFQNLAGLLNAIISVVSIHVGGRRSDLFKGFGPSSHALDTLKAVDYFMM